MGIVKILRGKNMKAFTKFIIISIGLSGSALQAMDDLGSIFDRIMNVSYDDPASPNFKDKVVQWIIQHPQAANLIGPEGKTPLISAISWLNFSAADALLSIPNIDVNKQDATGQTALHQAAKMDKVLDPASAAGPTYNPSIHKLMKDLLAKGARIDIKDKDGKTAYDLAGSAKQLLLDYQKQQSNKLLLEGARRGDWRAVQLAMRDGADINIQDTRAGMLKNTALHHAITYAIEQLRTNPGNKQTALNFVRLVLSYNPSIEIGNQGQDKKPGFTAFELALISPDMGIMTVLTEYPEERMSTLLTDPHYCPSK